MSAIPSRIDDIRARANRATPGPWAWFGNTAVQSAYLATQRMGRHFVMTFDRWGMRGAQPSFYSGRTVEEDERGAMRIRGGEMHKASEIPIYEVAPHAADKNDPSVYRQDIIGFRNADADFIAHSREDIDILLAEVDRLAGLLEEGIHTADTTIGQVRQIGWFCEHRYGTPQADTHMSWDYKKQKLKREPNTNSAMSYLSRPSDPQRCPAAKPMFVATETEGAEL